MKLWRFLPIFLLFFLVLVFFRLFILHGLLPTPSDTLVGLYYPFRDLWAKDYPRGIPYKNFLITDPVLQQYPWRNLAISQEKKWELPLWNPYNGAGTPLLANIQSAPWYPLNVLFFVLPFSLSWAFLILLQPLLAAIFMYLYLSRMRLSRAASFLGAISFALSGFSIVWLEWNTIMHVALWLPLLLLAQEHLLHKTSFRWIAIFIFALLCMVLGGHVQTMVYGFLVSNVYLFFRVLQLSQNKKEGDFVKKYLPFLSINLVVFVALAVVWVPQVQLFLLSARGVDQVWQKEGWFIPWQNLVQFIIPDFFGNPATLNYFGVWNYAEFVGYIGIVPFFMAIVAMCYRRDKKTLFFGVLFFLSLVFALPTFLSELPFRLHFPFFSSSQPTRLLFVSDFSLAILSAFGVDYFMKNKKSFMLPLLLLGFLFTGVWIVLLFKIHLNGTNASVAKSNSFLPTALFLFASVSIFVSLFIKSKKTKNILLILLICITIFDLFRFATKFLPFTKKEYLFPSTQSIAFLKNQPDKNFRIMATDRRILPPNVSIMYQLQSIDIYDPLYLKQYAEYSIAMQRNKPDISAPFGFNRIITPQNYNSRLIDLLNVKYVFSLSDISSPKLKKVFQEGQTRVYENMLVLPRAFFVKEVIALKDKNQVMQKMFTNDFDPTKTAYIEELGIGKDMLSPLAFGNAMVKDYKENYVIVQTNNTGKGFLLLTDTFYPTWHVTIDNIPGKMYRSDYNFRGVFVPKGQHTIRFFVSLL